ncbi:MAG: hypothetical protein LBT58_01915 [Endomicrobium sp.]|jgi:hypothetical protein|nr:hypothetical protein [Endomicrobium sp.]
MSRDLNKEFALRMLDAQLHIEKAKREGDYEQLMPGFHDNPFSAIVSALVLKRLRAKADAERAENKKITHKFMGDHLAAEECAQAKAQEAALNREIAKMNAKREAEEKRQAFELNKDERHDKRKAQSEINRRMFDASKERANYERELERDKRKNEQERAITAFRSVMKSFGDPREMQKYAEADAKGPEERARYEDARVTEDKTPLAKKTFKRAASLVGWASGYKPMMKSTFDKNKIKNMPKTHDASDEEMLK